MRDACEPMHPTIISHRCRRPRTRSGAKRARARTLSIRDCRSLEFSLLYNAEKHEWLCGCAVTATVCRVRVLPDGETARRPCPVRRITSATSRVPCGNAAATRYRMIHDQEPIIKIMNHMYTKRKEETR